MGDNIKRALILVVAEIIYVLFSFPMSVGNHAMIGNNCDINVTSFIASA